VTLKTNLLPKIIHKMLFYMLFEHGSRGVRQTKIWVALKKVWEPLL